MKVSIGKAARELGVSRETLRKWEAVGKIQVDRAANGRRRYDLNRLAKLTSQNTPNAQSTVAYARVSRPEYLGSLDRQVSLLESYCAINGWPYHIIKDSGIGLNFRNTGLRELIARICDGDIGRLVIPSVNRLPRIGMELIFTLCEQFGTEVVVLNATDNEDSDEELSEDIEDIASLFSARLYQTLGEERVDVTAKLRDVASELRPPDLQYQN